MPYSLSVTEGSSYNLSASDTSSNLSLGLMGPSGPSGPAGLPDALTFEGADPNLAIARISGTLVPDIAGDLDYLGVVGGVEIWSSGTSLSPAVGDVQLRISVGEDARLALYEYAGPTDPPSYTGSWYKTDYTSTSPLDFAGSLTPDGTTGVATLLFVALEATYLGQLCLASGGWWKWNGDVWEEEASGGGGGGVTDHGLLDGLGDDDHTQYFNQTRGDARYPSITYAGANPNYPQSLTLTGVDTAGVNGTLVYCGLINGKAAWSSDGTQTAGVSNPSNTRVSSDAAGNIWYVERGSTYAAFKTSTAATPIGLTVWTLVFGSGQPVIAASITAPSLPVGTHIGQFCQASGGLWRWNGSAWFEVTATASSISNAAVLAALPSSTPLPIASGGTGGATQSAAWTGLGGAGTIVSPVFTNITIGGGTAITTSGTTGAALVEAGNPAAALAILGIQSKTGTSTGLAAVGVSDITGLTGYTLEASTWYKLELHYLWTSTSSNFQINFVTTGTFERGATTPALGQSMSATTVISTTFFPASDSTYFSLRGSVGENRNNVGFFGYAYFKTGTSGTGKIQLQLLSGTTLSTINSAKAVLTKL